MRDSFVGEESQREKKALLINYVQFSRKSPKKKTSRRTRIYKEFEYRYRVDFTRKVVRIACGIFGQESG